MKPFPQCDPFVRAGQVKKTWPHGVPTTGDGAQRLARGWPHLRIITKGTAKTAAQGTTELDGIDPGMGVTWPRPAAERYLATMIPKRSGEARIDALVDEAVSNLARYRFHWEHAVYLLEVEHSANVVADRIVARLERMTATEWKFDNPHNRILTLIGCLEYLLLRCPEQAAALCERLRVVHRKRAKQTLIAQRLAIAITGRGRIKGSGEDYTSLCGYLVGSKAMLAIALAEHGSWVVDPQHVYLFGPSVLTPARTEPMRRDPRYKQQQRAEAFSVFKHPAVTKMLAEQSKSVAAKQAKPLSEAQLDRLARARIKRLVAEVNAVRGKVKAEKAVWTAAVGELIELRAAAGDPCPEELIGHMLGVDGWGESDPPAFDMLEATEAETGRWFDYIDAVTDR